MLNVSGKIDRTAGSGMTAIRRNQDFGRTCVRRSPETGIWEIWAHKESPILDRLSAILTTRQPSYLGRRYDFVTVQFSADKCAIERYEKPEKGEKMTCLSVL